MSTLPLLTTLAQVKDPATQTALRRALEAIDALASALAQAQTASRSLRLTPAMLSQIKSALEASGSHPLQLTGLQQSAFTSFAKAANEFLDSFNATTGQFTASQPAASNLSNGTTGSGAIVLAGSPVLTGTPTLAAPLALTLKLTAATPATAAGQLGLGTSQGFGAGAAGTAVTTTTKGGGTGPTTAETIVNYLKVTIAGADYYIPLMQ